MASYFTPGSLKFLRDLAANNERDWFQSNKERYLSLIQEPALQLIEDFAPRLAKISKHFVADPRPQGGSLFRIYRDIRFSKDKTPYKTYVGDAFWPRVQAVTSMRRVSTFTSSRPTRMPGSACGDRKRRQPRQTSGNPSSMTRRAGRRPLTARHSLPPLRATANRWPAHHRVSPPIIR